MKTTTVQLQPETLQRLRIRKAHNQFKTYDETVNAALDNSTNKNKGN